jgi:hypothetical protein
MATGTAVVDFGSFPGATIASVAVTGQSAILSGSFIEVWISPATTGGGATDHTHDEHLVDPPRVTYGTVVAGTGFTIYAMGHPGQGSWNPVNPYDADGQRAPMHFGKWNVSWVWQ